MFCPICSLEVAKWCVGVYMQHETEPTESDRACLYNVKEQREVTVIFVKNKAMSLYAGMRSSRRPVVMHRN
jgi:hypothetical protein